MNVVNLSGGKDSTWMLLEMLRRGIPVDLIAFADVGEMAEFEEMYAYLDRVEIHTGRKILRCRSKKHTARSMFYGYPSKGKYMDEIRGFPKTIGSGCRYRSWLKVDPLKEACGQGNDVYIGIAADEAYRSRCLEYAKDKKTRYHFPLVEWGITEQMCLDGLKGVGLYNNLYDHFRRLGCFWCPKQPLDSLRNLWKHFPDKWKTLRQMETDWGKPFKHGYPGWALEERFELEEKGLYHIKRRQPAARRCTGTEQLCLREWATECPSLITH